MDWDLPELIDSHGSGQGGDDIKMMTMTTTMMTMMRMKMEHFVFHRLSHDTKSPVLDAYISQQMHFKSSLTSLQYSFHRLV